MVQQAPASLDLILQRTLHCFRVPLHRSPDVPEVELPPADYKARPTRNLRSYVQRFNLESLRVDIPYEKFAITAFIVGIGIQSKDLMFSISMNPQASMVEMLSKAEKYINAEEALMSKRGSSSAQKEKSKDKKK